MTATVIPFPLERRVDAALAAASTAAPVLGEPWRPSLNRLCGLHGRLGYVREINVKNGQARIVFTGWHGTWTWAAVSDLVPPSTEGLEA